MSWIKFIRRTNLYNGIFERVEKNCGILNFYYIYGVNRLKNRLSKDERQKQMTAFRICCALALKNKAKNAEEELPTKERDNTVNLIIDEKEKSVLEKIAKYRGLKGKDYDYVFKAVANSGEYEINILGNEEKKRQIERILCDVFRVIYADGKISYQEQIFFHFLCVRLGILNEKTRADLYGFCKRRVLIEYVRDFNNYIEREIGKIIEIGKKSEKIEKKDFSECNLEKRLQEFDKDIERLYDKISNCEDNNKFYDELKGYLIYNIINESLGLDKIKYKDGKGACIIYEINSKIGAIDFCQYLRRTDKDIEDLINKLKEILAEIKPIDSEVEKTKVYDKIKENIGNTNFCETLKDKVNEDLGKVDSLKENYKKILERITSWATINKNRKVCYENLKSLCDAFESESKFFEKKANAVFFKKGEFKIGYVEDDLKCITINSLGDYRDYIKAVIKIERDSDEVAQLELEQHGEINKSHGKDLARYVDFMANNKLSITERKNLIFDLFKVILADNNIDAKEDLLFKICAIILNVTGEEYREIKNVLFELQARNEDNTKEYNKDRRYVCKKINKILKSDKVFLKNKQARFSLVCSLAFVDGELRTREKVELYDIGLRDYSLSERQIDEIISSLENKKERNQYYTEMLVNVPRDKKEKLKDLRNCRRIICSDDEVTDAERNAFEMVCIFYGVDKEFFSDKKYHNKELSTIPNEYLTEIDDEKRVKITREAYEKIEHIFKNKQVQGPLCGGIQYALDKRYNEHCRNLIRSDRRTTKYAFVIFSISALLLLVFINHHGLGSFKESKYHYELEHFKELAKDPSYYNKAVSAIADTLKDKSIDSLAKAIAINYVVDIDTALLLQYDTIQKNVKMNIKEDSTKVDWFNVKNRDSVSYQNMVEMTYNHVCKDSSYNCTMDSLNRMLSVFVKNEHIDSINQSIKDSIKSQVNKLSSDPVVTDYREKKAIGIINQLINGEDNLLLREYNQWLRRSNNGSLSTYEAVTKLVAEFFNKCNKWLSSYEALFWLIFITCVCVVVPSFRRFFSRMFLKHNLYTISALLVVLLAVSGELRTSVLLLSTMLSIEWLILMREKEVHNKKGIEQSHSKSHSSLLAILVIMAILADISFGMIELEQLYSLKNVSDKVFSALFLGCICFFVGKFMEMQYMHNEEDKKVMEKKLNMIYEYVKEEKQEDTEQVQVLAQIPCPRCRK